MGYVLGLDLGTSALKGLLVNQKGERVQAVSVSYPLIQSQSNYSEQNPLDWIIACEQVLQQLMDTVADFEQELQGISVSGQMHGLVVLDKQGKVLRPAILWNDTRTTHECQIIEEKLGEELIDITKNKALEGFTLPKIVWVQQHEPEIWQQVRYILLPKDYLNYWLTGHIVTEWTDASGTLLVDLEKLDWSSTILEQFQISKELLPKIYQSMDRIGNVQEEIAVKFKFRQKVQVFAGGADNACAAVGAGILSSERGLLSIGTSGVILAYIDQIGCHHQGAFHLFKHCQPEAYYAMGVTLSAGYSLNWIKTLVAPDTPYEELLQAVEHIEVGAERLLFAPYIMGERTPYADSMIRGAFIGLDARHTSQHLIRSVMEGVVFSLNDCKQLVEQKMSTPLNSLVSVGGGAKSKVWLQIQADILNVPIYTLSVEEGPGMGAAILAAVGLDWFDSLGECWQKWVQYDEVIYPKSENVEKYQKLYEIYQLIYNSVRELNQQLNNYGK